MSDDEPTHVPVDDAESEPQGISTLTGARQIRPGFCSNCNAATPTGAHFCPSCECFLLEPWVGQLASPKRRLGAAFLDSIIQDGGLLGLAIGPLLMPPGFARTIVAILSTVYWVSSIFLWSRGTTPAKRLLQMKVVAEDGEPPGFFRMAFRETIGKKISAMVFGLGLLAIPRDKERQGWHDKMVGTWVVFDDEP